MDRRIFLVFILAAAGSLTALYLQNNDILDWNGETSRPFGDISPAPLAESDSGFTAEKFSPDSAISLFKETFIDPARPVLWPDQGELNEEVFNEAKAEAERAEEAKRIADAAADGSRLYGPPVQNATEEDLVRLAYPQSYIDDLKKAEQDMINDKFIDSSERRSFSSRREITEFVNLWIDYLKFKGMADDKYVQNAKYTVNTLLPQIHSDNNLLKRKLIIKTDFLRGLVSWRDDVVMSSFEYYSKLLSDLAVPKAEAFFGGGICGGCYSNPALPSSCFTIGVGNAPGHVFFKPFCNCWGCYMYMGCLSACGAYTGPAVYHYYTGLCGCAGWGI